MVQMGLLLTLVPFPTSNLALPGSQLQSVGRFRRFRKKLGKYIKKAIPFLPLLNLG